MIFIFFPFIYFVDSQFSVKKKCKILAKHNLLQNQRNKIRW